MGRPTLATNVSGLCVVALTESLVEIQMFKIRKYVK